MKNTFNTFLESLKTPENTSVLEAVKAGYMHIFYESAPLASFGGLDMYFSEYNKKNLQEKPGSTVNYTPNRDNQFFSQTLSDKSLDMVNKSQSGVKGGRTMTYPPAGRDSDSMQNPFTRRNLGVQNSNNTPDGAGPTVGSGGTVGLGYATDAGGA